MNAGDGLHNLANVLTLTGLYAQKWLNGNIYVVYILSQLKKNLSLKHLLNMGKANHKTQKMEINPEEIQ